MEEDTLQINLESKSKEELIDLLQRLHSKIFSADIDDIRPYFQYALTDLIEE